MRDWTELGPVPAEEECAQIGTDDYAEKAREECKRYKNQLLRAFPDANLGIKGFPHDFGAYYEVVAYFDTDDEASMNLAFRIEGNLPGNWED